MKDYIFFVIISFFLIACKEKQVTSKPLVAYDTHVHIMSPDLIKYWKDLGISFSKEDYYYSNVDSILKYNQAKSINLIGMAYVYGNPEFYKGDNEYKRVQNENNYVLKIAKHIESNVKPFFAVDPLKDYAVKEIKRCVNINKNAGLKLHFSSSQVYLTVDEHLQKVKTVFKKASENNLPILLHFDNWHPRFGERDIKILADSILKDLEPIHLTNAHFGTSGGFNQKTKNVLNSFIKLFEEEKILDKHKILLDISAVALDKDSEGVSKLTNEEFKELKLFCDKLGYERIVFGTDYPLYTANNYKQILEDKLGLSKSEIDLIIKKK